MFAIQSWPSQFNKFNLDLMGSRVLTGKIVQSTLEECREVFATWINMVLSIPLYSTILMQPR